MFDSTELFIVTDSGTSFSGSGGMMHWIIMKNKNAYSLVGELQGFNLQFLHNEVNKFNDLAFDYVVYDPQKEYRQGRFEWNGKEYIFKELLQINDQKVEIPTDILRQIGYYFADYEIEHDTLSTESLIYDSLSYSKIIINTQNEKGYIVRNHNADHTYTSWLFTDHDTAFSMVQKFNDNIAICQNKNNNYFDLRVQYEDATDSILNCCKKIRLVWKGIYSH